MKYIIGFLFLTVGQISGACEVESVRRLNVSDGVQVLFKQGCRLTSSGNQPRVYEVREVKVAGGSADAANQVTTLATAALVNNLEVDVGFDRDNVEATNSGNRISIFSYFSVKKP